MKSQFVNLASAEINLVGTVITHTNLWTLVYTTEFLMAVLTFMNASGFVFCFFNVEHCLHCAKGIAHVSELLYHFWVCIFIASPAGVSWALDNSTYAASSVCKKSWNTNLGWGIKADMDLDARKNQESHRSGISVVKRYHRQVGGHCFRVKQGTT